MITDYALRLAENQTVSAGSAVGQHVIDLLQARNIGLGEPLYAVVTITTTFDALDIDPDNPVIQWVVYASDSSAKGDAATAHIVGYSSLYSCDVLGVFNRNLQKGQKISIPIGPITSYQAHPLDGANPNTTKGRRYVWFGFAVTGGDNFTAGAFSVDICTQAMLGGTSSTSDVPIYPTGITIA